MGRGKEELSGGEIEENLVIKNKLIFGHGGNPICCGDKARDERNRGAIERTK